MKNEILQVNHPMGKARRRDWRMIRSILDCHGKMYKENLREVGLMTLAERRERGDLIGHTKQIKGKMFK